MVFRDIFRYLAAVDMCSRCSGGSSGSTRVVLAVGKELLMEK